MKRRVFLFVLSITALAVSCDGFKEAVDSAVYPKVKGDYNITAASEILSSGNIKMSKIQGTMQCDKDGEGTKKIKVTNFESASTGKMSFELVAKFAKIESVPAYKIELISDKEELKEALTGLAIDLTTTQKRTLQLKVDKIHLAHPLKKVDKIVTIEPILNSVEHKGKKYQGVAYTNEAAVVTLSFAANIKTVVKGDITDLEVFASIQDAALKAKLSSIAATGDADEKTMLTGILAKFKEDLKKGIEKKDLTKKVIFVAGKTSI